MAAEVIVVVGACGGVGTSTLAALLARRRAVDGRTVLVDLDHGHGGAEVLLGVEDRPGARWADLQHVRGTLAPAALEEMLPRWGAVEVLSGDRRAEPPDAAAAESVWQALVDGCDSIVVDLPAHGLVMAGAAASVSKDAGVVAALRSRTDLLLVTGQDVLGVAAGLVVRRATAGPVQLVLRRRPAARVGPLEAAHLLDAPLLALLPQDRRVAEAVDRGFGPLVPERSRLGRAVTRIARGSGHG